MSYKSYKNDITQFNILDRHIHFDNSDLTKDIDFSNSFSRSLLFLMRLNISLFDTDTTLVMVIEQYEQMKIS